MTPDRRLRVFISSTLLELAVEREAVRDAISSLHLAPIFFEQGARPHAPRDLYAAYLDQCDVFLGIYWQSYGWVAPGSRRSRESRTSSSSRAASRCSSTSRSPRPSARSR